MKFRKSIKYRFRILIVTSILLTTILTFQLLVVFYSQCHERYLTNYYSDLLAKFEKNFVYTKGSLKWFDYDLNLQIYAFDDVEALQARIPNSVDRNKIISFSQKNMLESGHTIVNRIKTADAKLQLLIFIHPIMRDNKVEKVLFMHVPFNNLKERGALFSSVTVLVAFLSASITILISRRLFKKSLNQLQDIKLATIEVSKGNLDAQIFNNSDDEVGEITEKFNMMSTALKNEHTRIKEFMEDISHEIKTPLALVKNYNQALMDNIVQSEAEKQQCYHVIDRESNRLQKLIQNFLDFAKLNAQSVELERQPIVFAQFIEDIMVKYELTFKEKALLKLIVDICL